MARIPDDKLAPLEKFQRPYFSPKNDSYEIDWVSSGKTPPFIHYLFCININTRYLFVIPIDYNRSPTLIDTFTCLVKINNVLENKIKHIRADGDNTFGVIVTQPEPQLISSIKEPKYVRLGDSIYNGNTLTRYLHANNIELYLFKSPYTNKNRIIDRVVRTIRDMLVSNESFIYNQLVADAVDKYNNTKHSAFNHKYSPAEVQASHDLENVFIRENL
jgi:hypothetical protein